LHFFKLFFLKSVDSIAQKCHAIIVREIPLTKKKGVKYEKIGKKKPLKMKTKQSFKIRLNLFIFFFEWTIEWGG
jgi:hypothetical protein